MDPSFIPIQVVSSKTPFGLDQLRRTFKTSLSAESAIGAAPAVGTVDETFPFMFLMPISAPESAESATRIDLVYQGCLAGTESPTLPDRKHDSDQSVQSAQSSRGSTGIVLTSPISVQYYAPNNTLTYFSFGAAGTDVADDPTDDVQAITVATGDTSYTPTGLLSDVVSIFFSPLIVGSLQSTEVVPGQYWQNVSRKTKTLSPFLFSAVAGEYITLFAPGTGYTVGDSLTITDGMGHTAVVVLTRIGLSDSVAQWTVSSNTFDYSTPSPITASGGSGSGAAFYNVHIA